MIPCNSIAEEYEHIQGQSGELELEMQSLCIEDDDLLKPYDELDCICTSCGKHTIFDFDIKSFFFKDCPAEIMEALKK